MPVFLSAPCFFVSSSYLFFLLFLFCFAPRVCGAAQGENEKGRRRRPFSFYGRANLKPGSVRGGHSSHALIAQSLQQPTRATTRAAQSSVWSCSGWGLACRRCRQRRGALLPRLFTLARKRAVCFLCHFPSSRDAWPLASILLCGARTFLPRRGGRMVRSGAS